MPLPRMPEEPSKSLQTVANEFPIVKMSFQSIAPKAGSCSCVYNPTVAEKDPGKPRMRRIW
jgi:hypothetical protein